MHDASDFADVVDVAIVGAGPTGAVAARLCGLHGLSAVAFDREADVYDLPRAVGLWDDVQRILHNAGLLSAVLPSTCTQVGAEFVDAAGKRIVGIEVPEGLLTPNGYPPIRGFHQPAFERAVRSCLAQTPGVELRVAHEVVAIAQDESSVSLEVRDRATGATRTVRARWLLGCDGAASLVRKSCDIPWRSLGYDRDWLVVDVELERDVALTPLMTQICDPARPTTLVPLVPLGLYRWEFQLREGETRAEMEDRDRIWSLLERWISPADGRLARAVVYRFHATIAERFRHGRIFLAGDAAHQTPPFMGQGLSSGLRDVDNLVWKLAHVARGLGGEALLDTYHAERHPMAVAMAQHSINTGKLIDAYAEQSRGGPEPSPQLRAYAYGGGAELPDLSTGLLASDDSKWIGRRVPSCVVEGDGETGSFDDVVRRRWAILSTRDARTALDGATRRFWEALGTAFVTVTNPEGAAFGLLHAHDTVAVRPDRIIYGVGAAPFDLERLPHEPHAGAGAGAL